MTRRTWLVILVSLSVPLSLCCVWPVVAVVSYFSVPTPSTAELALLVRQARGNNVADFIDGEQTYEFVWVRRPRWQLVADPKGWVWMRIYNQDGILLDQGLQHILIALSEHPVVGDYVSEDELTDEWLAARFAEQEIRFIRDLQTH